MSMVGNNVNASYIGIAEKNADGVTIYYSYINDKELKVIKGEGKYKGNVVIPEEIILFDKTYKVTAIGDEAFKDCTNLTSVTLPNSITRIGKESFDGCSNLTSIDIPYGTTMIELGAFSGCSNLISITIPNSVTTIGPCAFFECCNLTSVTIPSSMSFIDNNVFYGCNSLTSVTIPSRITSIGDGAFLLCSSLTSITIPEEVTSIGGRAFYKCSGLTSINIPNNVTIIGIGAFEDCSSLTSISIGNSVKVIEDNAFLGCCLTSLTIPNSVTTIGTKAFYSDYKYELRTIVSLIENPFNTSGVSYKKKTFNENIWNYATLYVPEGTIDLYNICDGWRDFVHIIEGNPSDIEQMRTKIKLIQSENGKLTVQNVKNGTLVNVYNTNGTQVGSTISQNGQATIYTNLQSGSVAIVKIGKESFKVMIK